ncbi:5-oxoprolinase subunit PxpB [Pontibacter fetidus]|uniref:5-oxoprolinase subunit PxpB n=1 Tax=Pontibacter fetidus TaxID=2700082 RepID=A0A6B2HBW7_9BACT|nr:5-oxoprolinase subunit PxpB [Pontibacter fetidus]NDK57462.1 5-oxoprolinase subunit PxpB [Pontibacter fetidus]
MKQQDLASLQMYPLGDAAVVLQFGDTIATETHNLVRSFATYLQLHPFRGLIEFVPAFTTVTVYYNPWILAEQDTLSPYERIQVLMLDMLRHLKKESQVYTSREVNIPVCYGGKFGPDLAYVANHNHLTPEEVIAIHTSGSYQVYMIGFAPGFPYLGGLDERIAAPRKKTPRAVIPAGSVGIAGRQTGIYPIQTPGGWQLIGCTPLALFNPNRKQPSLLQAGDTVKFVAITPDEFKQRKELHVH